MPTDRLVDLLHQAQQRLRDQGDLLPTLIIEGDRPVTMSLRDLPRTPEGRQWLFSEIGRQVSGRHPWRATLVVDAYVKEKGPPARGSLADDPDAQDCIIAASLTRGGLSDVVVSRYVRNPSLEGLRVEFSPPTRFDSRAEIYLLEAFWDGLNTRSQS